MHERFALDTMAMKEFLLRVGEFVQRPVQTLRQFQVQQALFGIGESEGEGGRRNIALRVRRPRLLVGATSAVLPNIVPGPIIRTPEKPERAIQVRHDFQGMCVDLNEKMFDEAERAVFRVFPLQGPESERAHERDPTAGYTAEWSETHQTCFA